MSIKYIETVGADKIWPANKEIPICNINVNIANHDSVLKNLIFLIPRIKQYNNGKK